MSSLFIFLLQFLFIYNVNSANILGLFPYTGKSHHVVFEPLLRRLAEHGHNVTVASFFPMKNPPQNYEDISFRRMTDLNVVSFDLNLFEEKHLIHTIPILGKVIQYTLPVLPPLGSSAVDICERLIRYSPLTDALHKKYDLVITENFNSDCSLALLHSYGVNAPVVSILSGTPMPWTSQRIGADENPSHVPVIISRFTSKMSFLERLENTLINIISKYWYYNQVQAKERSLIEKKFGETPDLHDLSKNISLILINSFHALNGVKPLVPGMVEVGGIHLASEKKSIPRFIENFINESEHGVIVFSFGTHLKSKTLPKYKEDILLKVFSKLKQRVIWKFEDSGEEGTRVGNTLRVNWIPQYELLQHEKVIAFICHGGLLGMTEAVSSGTPMLVIPFFGDQFSNAAAASEAGVAKVVSYSDISEEVFGTALRAVLSEEYRSKAIRLSKIWKDRESSPLDTAVFWTERVLRWGHEAPLHSTSRDLPFYQLALLDVYGAIIAAVALFIFILFYIFLRILRLFTRGRKEKVH